MSDIPFHVITCGRAHREGRISFLPSERIEPNRFTNPRRRCFFQFAQHLRQTMRSFEPDEQMHMIGHAADSFRKPAKAANRSTEIVMQLAAPLRRDERPATLRTKDKMVVQTKISRTHRAPRVER